MHENVLTGFTLPVAPAALSFTEALTDYEARLVSKKVLIYPQLLIDPDMTEKIREVPIAYHILYFGADQGLRGVHLIIETRSYLPKYSSRAITIGMSNKNFGYLDNGMVTNFIGNLQAEHLAGAIREIEGKLVNQKEYGLSHSLFSGRPDDALYQYHVLLYQLKALRKE